MPGDTPAARQDFEHHQQARRLEPGDEAGRNALRLETAAAKADRIVSGELGRLNWKEPDLRSRRKSAPAKLAMAARLRRQTTLSIKAIASRVQLGTSKGANIRLHAAMRLTAPAETAQATFGL